MHVRVHVRAQGLDVEELSPVDQKRTHALLSYCLIKILQDTRTGFGCGRALSSGPETRTQGLDVEELSSGPETHACTAVVLLDQDTPSAVRGAR